MTRRQSRNEIVRELNSLKREQRTLRALTEELLAGVPLTCERGGRRRSLARELLHLCAHSLEDASSSVKTDLALGAQFLLSYNDRAALAILEGCVQEDYARWIGEARGRLKT